MTRPRAAIRTGLLAAAPFLSLQLFYLSDIDFWERAFPYEVLFFVLIFIALGWSVYLFTEIRLRRPFKLPRFCCPWFSLAAFAFLIGFTLFTELMRPLVLRVPRWSGVHQQLVWQLSTPDGDPQSLRLTLLGHGTSTRHHFQRAQLNWGSPSVTHLGHFDLTASPFSLSADTLRQLLQSSPLPEPDLSRLTDELTALLTHAHQGQPLPETSASIGTLYVMPRHHEDQRLGGFTWSLLLLIAFQLLSHHTLPKQG